MTGVVTLTAKHPCLLVERGRERDDFVPPREFVAPLPGYAVHAVVGSGELTVDGGRLVGIDCLPIP